MGGRWPLKRVWTAVPSPARSVAHTLRVVRGHEAVNFFKLTQKL